MIFKLPKENGVHYFSGLNQVAEGLLFLDIFKKNNQMTKIKARKLSLQFVPYLFIAITILTAFGSNSGTWA